MIAKERITKAKISLLVSQPWFGQLSCYLNIKETKGVPTAAINERGDFFFNPKFIDGLSDEEVKGIVCHEILHLAYSHPFRVQKRDMAIFNIAADLKVNQEIHESTSLRLPKGTLSPEYDSWKHPQVTIENVSKKTTEQIYEELLKKAIKVPKFILDLAKCGQGGGKGKDGKTGEGKDKVDPREIPALAREWKARVDSANSQLRGDMPAGLARELDALENPELPWYQIIRQRLKAASRKRTWNRPHKMYLPHYFPGSQRMLGLNAVLAFDTSGSMSQKQLTKNLSEAWGLAQAFRSIHLWLMSNDADVWNTLELKNGNKEQLKKFAMQGGGGTDFNPVFRKIKKDYRDNIDCLVFFTDGYGNFPEKKPFYPVYWVTDSRDITWPFGKVIHLKES